MLCFPSGFLAAILGKETLRGVLSYRDKHLHYQEMKIKGMGSHSVYLYIFYANKALHKSDI